VNKLDSVMTQLPYDYYSLPFCTPEGDVAQNPENLGEILSGDMIENSPYELNMLLHENCRILCRKEYRAEELNQFARKVRARYNVNWIIDNIPATTKHFVDTGVYYEKGFPLGFVGNKYTLANAKLNVAYLNNHISIKMFYHISEGNHKIVGFEVEPFSVAHQLSGDWKGPAESKLLTCEYNQHHSQELRAQALEGPEVKLDDYKTIYWTYDVNWEPSNIKWASRWDVFLKMTNPEIHWFSIINSLVIVLFLSAFVAVIMVRTLRRDLNNYNNMNISPEEQQEESGWKMIHGDVFRPPKHGGFFSVLIGSGAQIFGMALSTLFFALLGLLSPANRGALMTALLVLFSLMGIVAGYMSTRTYTMFQLPNWKTNTLYTSLFFPGFVFGVFLFLNTFIWGEKSSGAVPFTTLLALLVLWFGISVPLVYLGAHLAIKKAPIDPPCKINMLPRKCSEEKGFINQASTSALIGGILPFAAIFIELFFIMSSVWLHQFYYVFGFLVIVFVILIITCAEISIVMCYFQLCNENWHWWWRSFFTSGASAVYLLGYSMFYFTTRLEIVDFIPTLLYFGYMLLASVGFGILTGTIGHIACRTFVWRIYSELKVD
jgi:transmembrane 9 superfamily protein 2/4